MKKCTRSGLSILVFLIVYTVAGGSSFADTGERYGHGYGSTEGNGLGWHYSGELRAFVRSAAPVGKSKDPKWEYKYVAACDTANNPNSHNLLCGEAFCWVASGDLGTLFFLYHRPIGSDDNGQWTAVRSGDGQLVTMCARGAEIVPLADVEAEVRRIIEDKFREVARPPIELRPRDTAIVNLPVIAWTVDRSDVTLDIENPLPGHIRATPEYAWAWSNGATSTGAGMRYNPGISPVQSPDRYVSSTYTERGTGSVTLTVRWSATIEVPGISPVPLDPLIYTTEAGFDVAAAQSVLIDG